MTDVEPIDLPLMGALLRMPLDAIRARMLDDVHAAGFLDMVPAHSAVLRYPGPDGRRPSDLAIEAGMTRQAMNYLLGQLEELGYLVRRDDDTDGRSRRVYLTERGWAIRQCLRDSVLAIEAELEAELGSARLDQLRSLLGELNQSAFVVEFRRSEPA
jgi:DNA-binding MarR family transcriptional regulator